MRFSCKHGLDIQNRLESEYRELLNRNPKILGPADLFEQLAIDRTASEPMITSIYRTGEEQYDLCRKMGVKPYRSVHEFFRGIDFSVDSFTDTELDEIVTVVNNTYHYGNHKSVLMRHMGTGDHLHMQVPAGQCWQGGSTDRR